MNKNENALCIISDMARGALIRCTQISISVTNFPLAVFPNFNNTRVWEYNKHLMTGPEGNSSFCVPRISMSSRGATEGNIEIPGKQNELFPEVPVIK